MKAIVIERTGGPEVLEYREVPVPRPQKGAILVRAKAIGVNRPEIQMRRGIYPWMPQIPFIPGIELSGTVVETGEGADPALLGKKVFVTARDLDDRSGCYAEYIAVPADAVHLLPDGCDPDLAACLSNYQVASLLLSHAVPAGAASLFVAAASSGVGSALVELATLAGKTVVAGVSSQEKAARIAGLGASHVVVASETLAADVRQATRMHGVDAVLDPVGGDSLVRAFEMLAPFGTVVSYGRLAGRKQGDIYEAMFANQETSPAFRLFTMHSFDHAPQIRKEAMSDVIGLLARGKIEPIVHARFALADATSAHEMMEARSNTGKILLKP